MNPFGFVVLAVAVFVLVAAGAGWFRIGLFGRRGTRLFYVLIGIGLLWLAIMMLVKSV